MSKKLYVYDRLDVCDPGSEAWHPEGGLIVVTSGYPNDAVRPGTGNRYTISKGNESYERVGLPEPTHVYEVSDGVLDLVLPFPDAGCC